MDELRAVSLFVQVAEQGSFHKAASVRNTTPQAVSKTIRQLEQHLGVRLFHRTTRKSALTEEGERLLDAVRPNLEGLVGALARARDAVRDDEGPIRISAAGAVGRLVLIPLLAEFQRRHPGVQIDLLLEDRFSDLVADRIDVGFRAGGVPDAQVVARQLFPIRQIVCASPAYLREHGVPRELQDIARHRCTGYRQPGTGRPMAWELGVAGEIVYRPVDAAFCSSDSAAEMHAVLEGAGLGQIDSINATAPLREGRLVPVLVDHVSERMALFLYYPQRDAMPGRVRRLIEFAIERLSGSADFLVGDAELHALAARFEHGLTTVR